jgi:nucleotide-binding universal stress UspA family protein
MGTAAFAGPVVVGTDFSETATVALAEARRLAALLRVRVAVVHIADGTALPAWTDSGPAARWLRAASLRPADLIVRHGSPWVELARYAAEVRPTLLVVGSHGQSGYQPLAIGSTAARVSVQARCPVVLVSPRVAVTGNEVAGQDRTVGVAGPARVAAGVPAEPGNP